MKLYFYLSPEYWLEPIPTLNNYEERVDNGAQGWILQTYFRLKGAEIECELTKEIPAEGVIIFHKGAMDDEFKPNIKQLLVCVQADWGVHSFAQVHICQNPIQQQKIKSNLISRLFKFGNIKFIHYWPQSKIIPRKKNTPLSLKRLSYYGITANLAPELQSEDWDNFLKVHNIEWSIKENRDEWRDYSNTDAVIFCRDFNGSPYYHKPATKLYNSWAAGCLPIFTPESAFMAEIKNKPPASIVVNSYNDVKEQVIRLTKDSKIFSELVTNGESLAKDYTFDKISTDWKKLITNLFEELRIQQKKPTKHALFLTIRKTFNFIRKIPNK